MQESGINNQVSEKGNSGNARKNQSVNDQERVHGNDKGNNDQKSCKDGRDKNTMEEEEELKYFGKCEGNKLTVIFHAVLAPHFKFEASQGDRIFMRFGGAAFGNFNEDVVEVFPER